MSEINLQDKFPDMTPVNGAPTLWTVNTVGLSIYGRRDFDPETSTYIATRALCAIFMPLLFIDAYRVADAANGGWYFIGRVPMSPLAKLWNAVLVAAVTVGVGAGYWNSYVNSPSMVAKRQLADADAAVAQAQFTRAAELYSQVADSGTEHQTAAAERLWELSDEPGISELSPADSSQVLGVLVRVHRQHGNQEMGQRLVDRGLSLAEQAAAADASGADRILDSIASLADEDERFQKVRRSVLEQIVEQQPENTVAASKLAVAYEALGDMEGCQRLLTPLADRLEATEGARILGQILASAGKFDEAHTLLTPYCEQRLAMLHRAEQSYESAFNSARDRVLDTLQRGEGPRSFYDRYSAANEAEQNRMVNEYLSEQLRGDRAIASAQELFMAQADVVPVAIDLGVILLRRAQDMTDPALREAELERAEKTFKAIRGIAGESDEYRIYMGQVSYWLGKHDEGHQLFEDVLAANDRSPEMLMAVSNMLREVGLAEEARARAEEAYESGTTQDVKYAAASIRAAILEDSDDHIEWLRKCDLSDASTQAALAAAMGDQAMTDGNYVEAERQQRAAVDAYAKLAENPATLNNGALACLTLFTLTGDHKHVDKGIEMLERAISLSPSDSTLLNNAADSISSAAISGVLSPHIDLRVLGFRGRTELLSHLYDDEAGRVRTLDLLKSHPGIAKALELRRRELVLAPKRAESYAAVEQLLVLTGDVSGLEALRQQIEQTQPDTSAAVNIRLQFYRGENDDDTLKGFDRGAKRMTALVDVARKTAPGATFAVAVDQLVRVNYATYALRPVENLDTLVALAEEAVAAHASAASRNSLALALLLRACHSLEATDAEFASYAERTKRGLDAGRMIAMLGCRGGALADRVAQHPDVRRAIQIVAEGVSRLPNKTNTWRWALLQHGAPEAAAGLIPALQDDRVYELEREISLRLNPASTALALDQYWACLLAGDEEQGKAVLRLCADQGAPVPDFE